MYIDKAIRKQRKSFYLFIFFMVCIALVLPIISLFFIEYFSKITMFSLSLIEASIIVCIIFIINEMTLEYEYYKDRLKIKTSIWSGYKSMFCEKVVLVHTTGNKDNISLIIIYMGRPKSKLFKELDNELFSKYPSLLEKYKKVINLYPEFEFCYTIIKHGGLKKLKLLDDIYKNCLESLYTDEAIDNIKTARSNKKLNFIKGD